MAPKHTKKHLILAAYILTILFSGAFNAVAGQAQMKTYRNFEMGIEFDYPYNYVTSETVAPSGTLEKLLVGELQSGKPKWLFSVEPVAMASYPKEIFDPKTVPFLQFATDVARFHCDYAEAKSATYCPDMADIISFESANGTEGFEFALNQIREEYFGVDNSKTFKTVKSPVYAFDLTANKSMKVLLIEPQELATATAQGMELFKEIMKTFVLNRPNQKNAKEASKP